jgi:hypothetical protein
LLLVTVYYESGKILSEHDPAGFTADKAMPLSPVRNLTDASTVASLHVSYVRLLMRRVMMRNSNAVYSSSEQSSR